MWRNMGSEQRRLRRTGEDATNLVIDYVKQETVEPVRSLGRFVAYGLAGSIFLSIGLVLLLLSLLRALQEETGAFNGNLSWLPYLIVVLVALAIAALAGYRISAGPAKRRRSTKEGSR